MMTTAVMAAAIVAAVEKVAAAKTIATAEAVAAAVEIALGSARGSGLGGGKVDAMDRHHLHAALGIRQVADQAGARRQILVSGCRQHRGVTESVAAIVQGHKAVALGAVKPFDFAFRRGLRKRLVTLELSHEPTPYPCRFAPQDAPRPAASGRSFGMMPTETPDSQRGLTASNPVNPCCNAALIIDWRHGLTENRV